jgi:hypothetical protein
LGNLACNVLNFESKFDALSTPEYKNMAPKNKIQTPNISLDAIEKDIIFSNNKLIPRKL